MNYQFEFMDDLKKNDTKQTKSSANFAPNIKRI